MELRHVRYFVVVAEELHFGRAARRTRVAQPALSKQVRSLESELGVELLDRGRRQVGLTDAGRAFLEEAYAILDRVGQAERTAVRAARGEIGRLAVGFTGMTLYGIFPEAVRAFGARFPGVDLAVQERCTRTLSEGLLSGDLQVGLLHPPVAEHAADALAVDVVRAEPLIAALPEGHPLSGREEISVADLADDAFVAFPRDEGPEQYDETVAFCRRAGFSPRVANETASPQTVIGLVAAGVGVSLVWESMGNLKRPGVVYSRLAEPAPRMATAVAWRRGNPSAVVKNFVEVVKGLGLAVSHVSEPTGPRNASTVLSSHPGPPEVAPEDGAALKMAQGPMLRPRA